MVHMRNHIHDIKFIRMFGTQKNCTIYPQNRNPQCYKVLEVTKFPVCKT